MASGNNNMRRALDLTETPPTSPGVERITAGVERIVLDRDRRLVQAQAELAAATQATLDAEAAYERTPRFNEAARSAAFALVNANSKRVRELTAEIERLRQPAAPAVAGPVTPAFPRTPVARTVPTTPVVPRTQPTTPVVVPRTQPTTPVQPRVEQPPRLSASDDAQLRTELRELQRAYEEEITELESASDFDRFVKRLLDEERALRRTEDATQATRALDAQIRSQQQAVQRVRAAVDRATTEAKRRIEQYERELQEVTPGAAARAFGDALRVANLREASARQRDRLLFYSAYAAALELRAERAVVQVVADIEALERQLADLNTELAQRFPNNRLLLDNALTTVARQQNNQRAYRTELEQRRANGRSALPVHLERRRFLQDEEDRVRDLRARLIDSEAAREQAAPAVPVVVQPVVQALQAENEAGEARADVQADNVVALRDHVQRENAAVQAAEENRARNTDVVGGLLQYARDAIGGLVRRDQAALPPAPVAVNQAVAAIDNVAQAIADQNADERAEAEQRANRQAALEAEQRANEENLDLVIVIPMEARFPRLGASGDDVGDDPNTFIARTFANAADFVEWTPGTRADEPGQLRLRNIRSQTIAYVFESLFGPILDAWWREDALHTYHWMNTVIPFITAVALAFRAAVVKAEATDAGVPQALARAYKKFGDMFQFALFKALTGLEAEIDGRIPNKQQPQDREPSPFEVDENYTNNPTVVAWLRDRTTQNQLRLGVPVVQMIFGLQKSMQRRELSVDYAGNFARLFEATTAEDEDRLNMTHVRFAELVRDKPPERGEIATESLQSFESRVSRILGLPVLDVLYADDAANSGTSPENFMFQDVREQIDSNIFARYGILPSFFRANPPQRGLQAVTRDGDNDIELIIGLLREAAAAEAAAPATGRSRRARGRGGRRAPAPEVVAAPATDEELLQSFGSARDRTGINLLYNAVARRPNTVGELEVFELLAFPALLNQLANVRGLWDASLAGAGDDLRRPLAYKLLAGALFQNVALNANDAEAFEAEEDKSALDYSFFGRIALRPKYSVFIADPESEMPRVESRYLETTARPTARGRNDGGGRRRRSKSMGARMVRGAMVVSDASFSSIFERPRITLPKLSKSIAQNRAIGSQVYQYLALLREFDGELLDELDSEIEPMRTVLVPSDRAIAQYTRSAEFLAATRGLDKEERDRYLIDVVRYHVLARQVDFERLLKDRVPPIEVPTELQIELAGGEERALLMRIEVVGKDEARERGLAVYSDKTGGTLHINGGDGDGGDRESLYVIGGKQRARNGDYYIINRVIDPERAKELGLEGRSLRRGDAARPRATVSRRAEQQVRAGEDFEAEDVFRDVGSEEDDDEEEEERRVRFARTEPERLRAPPSLVRSNMHGGGGANVTREYAIEAWIEAQARRRGWVGPNNARRVRYWLENARADLAEWRRIARDEPERRREMEDNIRRLESAIEQNVRRLEREENEEMARNADRIDAERMSIEQLMRSRASPQHHTVAAGATAALAAASQQRATKTLAKAQESNEKDFEPMKRMLAVSGVRQEIIDARCAGKNVYVLAPTREALRRAGIDVDQMSDDEVRNLRDFVRSHVLHADWESESSPGRRMRGPMMPQDFIWMLQQRNRTPVRTLAIESSGASAAAADTIHYVPLHERSKPTAPEHEHAQLHIDDLQLDRPQHTYAGDKDVFVYFLNRTLVAPKAAVAAAAAPQQQQQKASGAPAKEAAVTPTQAAPGGAKLNWSELASSVERALKTNTNQAAYHDDVLRFGRAIDELGGPKKVVSVVPVADVDRTFERLHSAISRNQHIGTEHKTKAHDALDQMFARF